MELANKGSPFSNPLQRYIIDFGFHRQGVYGVEDKTYKHYGKLLVKSASAPLRLGILDTIEECYNVIPTKWIEELYKGLYLDWENNHAFELPKWYITSTKFGGTAWKTLWEKIRKKLESESEQWNTAAEKEQVMKLLDSKHWRKGISRMGCLNRMFKVCNPGKSPEDLVTYSDEKVIEGIKTKADYKRFMKAYMWEKKQDWGLYWLDMAIPDFNEDWTWFQEGKEERGLLCLRKAASYLGSKCKLDGIDAVVYIKDWHTALPSASKWREQYKWIPGIVMPKEKEDEEDSDEEDEEEEEEEEGGANLDSEDSDSDADDPPKEDKKKETEEESAKKNAMDGIMSTVSKNVYEERCRAMGIYVGDPKTTGATEAKKGVIPVKAYVLPTPELILFVHGGKEGRKQRKCDLSLWITQGKMHTSGFKPKTRAGAPTATEYDKNPPGDDWLDMARYTYECLQRMIYAVDTRYKDEELGLKFMDKPKMNPPAIKKRHVEAVFHSLGYLPEGKNWGDTHVKKTMKHWLPEQFHTIAYYNFDSLYNLLGNEDAPLGISVSDRKNNALKLQLMAGDFSSSMYERRIMVHVIQEMMKDLEDEEVEE